MNYTDGDLGIWFMFEMNLQQHYDLEICRSYEEEQIKKEIHPLFCPKVNSRVRKNV